MLTITENAADAIRGIVATADAPDGTGLRIASQPGGGEAALELTLAQLPAEDDEVVDEHGAQVFLDPQAADLLGDKLLDAQAEGSQVGFVIGEQG